MRYKIALAAIAATTAFATPAAAQFVPDSSATIEARALLIQPATLQRLEDLSFGTIIAAASASGSVSIDPDTGARVLTPGLTGSSTDVGGRGRLIGNGLPQQAVNLRFTFPAFLSNVQDLTRTVAFSGTYDSDGLARTIGATGVFYVGVGGSIAIAANQMPGQYTGDVTVDADFQ